LVNCTGLGHLQEKLFSRLLVRWTLKHHDSIRSVAGGNSTPAQPEIRHRQLLRGGPSVMPHELSCPTFAPELHLRGHQQDCVLAGIDHRKQNRDLIASIENFTDSNPQSVAFFVLAFNPLTVELR
jgi:hypothetical protein